MAYHLLNKRKILNDPVYGFINIPSGIAFEIIEHPYFQRLRRIKQLGLTDLVYPGAVHTRFQHTLGAVHLLESAIDIIRSKGHNISPKEETAVTLAILLHDIGHGPFSHTLERVILPEYGHEELSVFYMHELNQVFGGALDLAIKIFQNNYHKKFLHQLVSSQLDVDRMDYLRRDSFYTGVSEGVIGSDRIIKMLNVVDDELVVEAKGIYSIEKFLIARWLMYWQVYLHKTVVSSEQLLLQIFKRVRFLIAQGTPLYLPESLHYFYLNKDKKEIAEILKHFARLDDTDIISCIKQWAGEKDPVLNMLSERLIHRNLYRVEIQNHPFDPEKIAGLTQKASTLLNLSSADTGYFVFTDYISKHAYSVLDEKIQILYKDGKLVDVAEASDMLNVSVLSKTVRKYFLCYPKEIS
ncbi:MAG: HD domain-containing protein [Bacteroidales bacterium]|nr:HD domain-containing protein [Bacteroidales bacterium]